MDAAAGVYVDSAGILRIYSAYHWRSDNIIRFNEYRPVPDFLAAQIVDIENAWIDLYEHDHFRGRCLSLAGRNYADFSNYSRIFVHGATFNDQVSSARFQIPAGCSYRLFEHRNFEGRVFDLDGTGTINEIRDFKALDFGDAVSSSRYEKVV